MIKKEERERNDLAEGPRSRTERNNFKKVGTCPALVILLCMLNVALLSILSLTLLLKKILALLFWDEGGFNRLNSVVLLFILSMTLLFLPYIFFLYIFFLYLFLLYIFFMSTSWLPTLSLQLSFLSYCIKLSLQIYVWLQVYIRVRVLVDWLFSPHCSILWFS